MGRIALLPVELANKIAAGEVVERPASVVKELVENAIDAGATRVDVQLTDAGKTLIRVADDGGGIEPEDLPLALAAHATSKLSTVDDLFNLGTNGFRGEALASIQSVARVRIVSQARDSGRAFEIESQGGLITDVRQCAGAPGTVIEVRDLFYNVPARRRWLKGDASEFAASIEILQAIAAANPEIGFSLRHGERKAMDLPPRQQPAERVLALFGDRFSEGHLELHEYETYARLDGIIAPPAVHRPNSKALLLFVNRRPVKDRSLLQAVLLAYREFVPPGRYPVGVLFLTVEPRAVDVNVHPSKTEVRLFDHNRIFSLIKSAVTDRLVRSGVLPSIRVGGNTGPLPQARPDTEFEPRFDLEQSPEPPRLFGEQAETNARDAAHRWERAREVLDRVAPPVESDFAVKLPVARQELPVESPGSRVEGGHRITFGDSEVGTQDNRAQPPTLEPQRSLLSNARGLFQVGNTYLVVETPDGMVVIDQHAYHERILYWLLENRIASQPPERQRLLVPQPLELSLNARALADAFKDELLAFGFELEPFGPDSFALRAVPKYSVSGRHTEVVSELLEELAQGRTPPTPEQLRKSMVEMVACKAAIKAGDALKPEQILDLLRLGETIPHTFSCPHGRPTTYKLGFADLEKIFHRR